MRPTVVLEIRGFGTKVGGHRGINLPRDIDEGASQSGSHQQRKLAAVQHRGAGWDRGAAAAWSTAGRSLLFSASKRVAESTHDKAGWCD